MAGITSGGLSNTEYEALHSDLLDEVDTLGWPFALSWHRGITMAAYTSTGTAAELQIYTNFDNGINDYFGGLLSRMTIFVASRQLHFHAWDVIGDRPHAPPPAKP